MTVVYPAGGQESKGAFYEWCWIFGREAVSFPTMKALVHIAPNKFEIQDFPKPAPGPKEALLRVKACGICGSDIHG
jgi:hypothetical protein